MKNIQETRADQWVNQATGMGTARDPGMQAAIGMSGELAPQALAALYEGDPIARLIVDRPVEDMLREGYEVACEIDIPDGLQLEYTIAKAARWARLYGGSLVIIGSEGDKSKPMPEDVAAPTYLTVLHRGQVSITSYYTNPFAPKYMQPEFFTINTLSGAVFAVHESWTLPFRGLPRATDGQTGSTLFWGLSVLQICTEALTRTGTSAAAASAMVNQASIGVFSLTGLYDQIASGEKDVIQTRMQYADMSKSLWRSLLLDKEGEEFKFESPNFAGITDIMGRLEERLSAACGIPVSVLFGRSASGLNASSDGDYRVYLSRIRAEQHKTLEPIYEMIYGMFARAQGLSDTDIEVSFNPLWSPTAAEQATIEKMQADRDGVYIDKGVWTPEEVALSRASGVSSSAATEIDEDGREKAQRASVTFADPNPVGNDQTKGTEGGNASKAKTVGASASAKNPTD